MRTKTLLLEGLDKRHPGITPAVAGTYAEAARVCLDRHHTSPIVFQIDRGENSCKAATEWTETDQRAQLAWANTSDATRDGAYCVAIAAVELTDGLVAVSRAETQTGADYYLGAPNEKPEDLESSLRLEVSGVDQGNTTKVRSRLGQKVKQAQKGNSPLPAIAAVVGFQTMTVLTADVESE
jgi:hypothetical protein